MENREFSLADFFAIATKWIWLIVVGMVVCGLLSFYYSAFMVTPVYSSTSKFLTYADYGDTAQGNIHGSQQILDNQRGVTLAQMVAVENVEILGTRYFANELKYYLDGNIKHDDSEEKISAIKKLGKLENEYSAEKLQKMLSFATKEQSTVFAVQVKSNSENDAYVIAKYIEVIAPDYVTEKNPSGATGISVIDGALPANGRPINDNAFLNTLIGIVAGFVVSFCVAFIIDINDTRVKDDKELIQVFPIPVLGAIPDFTAAVSGSSYAPADTVEAMPPDNSIIKA